MSGTAVHFGAGNIGRGFVGLILHRPGYEGGHMDILSRVAILFSDTDEVDKLVAAQSTEELFELLNAVNED